MTNTKTKHTRDSMTYLNLENQECIIKLKDLVKFPYHTMNGIKPRCGNVTRFLINGKIEVKMQMGGYHIISVSDIIAKSE